MLKEASMNISMTGNTSSEVLELMAILKNAGLDTAHLVTDMDINQPMPDEGEHMCPACAAAHSMDTPCGEAVEEEYANSPDEEYQDDSYMLQDLSGGLNRKKDKGALRAKDPAITYEEKLKAQLKKNLYEKYEKLDEVDWLKKGIDTVSGWFNGGDDTQPQTTKKTQTTTTKPAKKPAANKNKQKQDPAAQLDAEIANIKKQPDTYKSTQTYGTGSTVTFNKEQMIKYLEQKRDHYKSGGDQFGLIDKENEFIKNAQSVGSANKGDKDAEKQDQTQAQKVSATDDNAQQAPPANDQQAPPANDQQAPPANDQQAPPANDQQAPPADNTQAATGDQELSGGTTNPQAGPPPTPPKGQEPTAEPATQPDISQTQPTGAEKKGGAAKPATNDQANYFQQQRSGGAAKPAAKPATNDQANYFQQQRSGGAAPKGPANTAQAMATTADSPGQSAGNQQMQQQAQAGDRAQGFRPNAQAGGQPRPKNVSQARQQARLRATKAAPKAQAGQAAGNKAADRGKAAAAAINAAGNQGNAAQNVPQEVMNVTKQAIDALQKHGMSAGNIINLISSFAK